MPHDDEEEIARIAEIAERRQLTPEELQRWDELLGPLGPNEGVVAWESFRIEKGPAES